MSELKVYYFNMMGRGECIRFLLHHAGVQFDDIRIESKDWPALKPTMVGNSMPNIELPDGTKLGATNAIMRYLGAKYGYYPQDTIMAY